MIEERGVIPLTTHTTGGKYWVDVVRDQLPELPLLVSTRSKASSPGVCPTTESAYPAVIYFNGYVGYAINTRWTEGLPSGANEFKKWEAIPNPASYPWFADPYVSQSASPVGFSNMGVQSSDGVSWNIGFEHTDDVANSVFADGHVEQVSRGDLMDVDAVGTPLWFLADH